jgi:hypothetical protein
MYRLTYLALVFAGLAVACGTNQAQAAPPERVSILVCGTAPPPYLEGTGSFLAIDSEGDVWAEGDAGISVRLADATGHVELRLGSKEKGILIWAHTTFENPEPGKLLAEGPWTIIDATGDYDDLRGAGKMVVNGDLYEEYGTFTYELEGFVVDP